MARHVRFTWDHAALEHLLGQLRFSEGMLLGRIAYVGPQTEAQLALTSLTSEVVASASIEGTVLHEAAVRDAFCRLLRIDDPLLEDNPDQALPKKTSSPSEAPAVQGAVRVLLDATRHFDTPVDHARLMEWHKMFFPSGYAGARRIVPGHYRSESGTASVDDEVFFEMNDLLDWINNAEEVDPLIKAGVAHLGFLMIRPFGGGDGRVVRALTELLLTRADVWSTRFTRLASGEEEPAIELLASSGIVEEDTRARIPQRFYSMSPYILAERDSYRQAVTQAREGIHIAQDTKDAARTADITEWLTWFLRAELRSIELAASLSQKTLGKAHGSDEFWRQKEAVSLNDRQRHMLTKLRNDIHNSADPTQANTMTNSLWSSECNVSADTALRDITDLVNKGLLIKEPFGGRGTRYHLPENLL